MLTLCKTVTFLWAEDTETHIVNSLEFEYQSTLYITEKVSKVKENIIKEHMKSITNDFKML